MNDLKLLTMLDGMDPALLEESMVLFQTPSATAKPGKAQAFSRFFNSGWGVAVVCAIVSFGVMTGIIWAVHNPPDEPTIPIGGTEESRHETATAEPAVTENESDSEFSTEMPTEAPTEGVMYDPITQDGFTFVSKGDGTCSVNAADSTLKGKVTVPEVSPYGDRVTAIAAYGFKDCTAITTLILPDSVTSIETGAFRGCNGLLNIQMPKTLTYMGSYVFQECTRLESVIMSAGLTTLPRQTFETCTELKMVELKDGLTKIGDNCFNGCSRLQILHLPATLESIGNSAFLNCCGLRTIYFGGTREQWEAVNVHKIGNGHLSFPSVIPAH